jgi:hypothetical protein
MPPEAEHRGAPAASSPKIGNAAKGQCLDQEADPGEALSDELLATLVQRSDGAPGKQIPSEVKGLRHRLSRL